MRVDISARGPNVRAPRAPPARRVDALARRRANVARGRAPKPTRLTKTRVSIKANIDIAISNPETSAPATSTCRWRSARCHVSTRRRRFAIANLIKERQSLTRSAVVRSILFRRQRLGRPCRQRIWRPRRRRRQSRRRCRRRRRRWWRLFVVVGHVAVVKRRLGREQRVENDAARPHVDGAPVAARHRVARVVGARLILGLEEKGGR